jgi:hypothetical protein
MDGKTDGQAVWCKVSDCQSDSTYSCVVQIRNPQSFEDNAIFRIFGSFTPKALFLVTW